MEVQEKDVISYITFVTNRYIKERKLLDKQGIDEIIKSLIILNDLSYYIKDVKYTNSSNGRANMSYSYFNKCINVTPDFIKGITKSSKELLDLYKLHDDIIITNIDIIHAIIHEVMHAKQYKFLDESDDVLLKDLLIKSLTYATYDKADNKDEAMEFAKATQDMSIYQLMPSELNAEINALKQTIQIIDHMSINSKYKYIELYELHIDLLSIHSYQKKMFKVLSPVEQFVKIRKKYIKDTEKIILKGINKYDLDTRLSYGLPISIIEYNTLDNKIKNTIKDLMKG